VNSSGWPFHEPRNLAVFTVRQVLKEAAPILRVCHDEEDGEWQFLTGGEVSMSDAMIVALEEITKHDPSVLELFDLPEGFEAYRDSIDKPWSRIPNPPTSRDEQ